MARSCPGNTLALLENGAEYFPALLAEMARAEREIHLESYIFELDATGRAVMDALLAAARRGVQVRMLLDGFGARSFPLETARTLRLAGIALMFYRPDRRLFHFRRHRLRRMHRKIVVIDARTAFVGGINIIDDRHQRVQGAHRYDFAVRVEGPLLREIYPAVRRLWWLVRWSQIGRRPPNSKSLPIQLIPGGAIEAAFLQRDNIKHRRDIEEAYLAAIRGATTEILIANAYFLPGRRFRQALIDAAARGVSVRLILQGYTDHLLYQQASRALYRYFLENGIRIFEYQSSELHAKTAVVDGVWATVGSSNIDPFSLLLAREANVEVRDRGFAADLKARLQHAQEADAVEIQASTWQGQPLWQRAISWLIYGLLRLLMGVLGLSSRRL